MNDFENAEAEQSLQDSHSALLAVQTGKLVQLGELAESLRPYLKHVVNQHLPLNQSLDDASDIVQQALMKAVSSISDFRGSSPAHWRAWLTSIARNEVKMSQRFWASSKRSRHRTCRADVTEQLADDSVSPSAGMLRAETASQLDRALERLSSDQRQLVDWRQSDQLSHAEIAQRLAISVDAARQRCKSAMDALRQHFRELAG